MACHLIRQEREMVFQMHHYGSKQAAYRQISNAKSRKPFAGKHLQQRFSQVI